MPKISDQWLRDILSTLYQGRTSTRREIIRATGLNGASVSHSLKHLLNSGTIVKVGELQSTGGRKREVLKLNAEAGYFVAIDLEGTRIRIALTNIIGDIRYRWEEDVEFGQELQIRKVADGIEMVLRNLDSRQRSRVLATGISHPGIVDKAGRVTAFNVGWHKFPLREQLQEAVGLPVFLEHAHRTCILAERSLGCAQNIDNCIYVMVGNGVGASIFSDGKPVGGRDQMAGEFGHIIIDPRAEDRCNCGKHGCLESIASSPNIIRQYLEKKTGKAVEHAFGARVTEVFQAARENDSVATEVLGRAAKSLGHGISYLINLFNPELIILGGDILQGEDVLLPLIKKEAFQYALPDFLLGLKIRASSLGFDIGLKGATSLAFRNSLLDSVLLKKICSPVSEMYTPAEHSRFKGREHRLSSRSYF
ncbi:MAG TPA: ROK family protein [Acidobacteriota bacterium]|jgi:predicted NBD/HSP70 family sugar kinase